MNLAGLTICTMRQSNRFPIQWPKFAGNPLRKAIGLTHINTDIHEYRQADKKQQFQSYHLFTIVQFDKTQHHLFSFISLFGRVYLLICYQPNLPVLWFLLHGQYSKRTLFSIYGKPNYDVKHGEQCRKWWESSDLPISLFDHLLNMVILLAGNAAWENIASHGSMKGNNLI